MNSHETATPMHAPNFHPMTVLLNQRKRAIFRSLRASRGYVYPDGILRVPRVGAVSHNTPFVSTVSSDEWSGPPAIEAMIRFREWPHATSHYSESCPPITWNMRAGSVLAQALIHTCCSRIGGS